jgi:uncharacterized protein YbbC (DUF1343 family)
MSLNRTTKVKSSPYIKGVTIRAKRFRVIFSRNQIHLCSGGDQVVFITTADAAEVNKVYWRHLKQIYGKTAKVKFDEKC